MGFVDDTLEPARGYYDLPDESYCNGYSDLPEAVVYTEKWLEPGVPPQPLQPLSSQPMSIQPPLVQSPESAHISPTRTLLYQADPESAPAAPVSSTTTVRNKPTHICGVRKNIFIFGCILAFLLIVTMVGVAVGISTASDSSNDQTTDTSASSATIASTPSLETVQPSISLPSMTLTTSWPASLGPTPTAGTFNCPADNNSKYYPPGNKFQRFTKLCNQDFPGGSMGADGTPILDIRAVIATSLASCIDQCVAWNNAQANTGIIADPDRICTAVAYGASLTDALSRPGIYGNCFLKNQRTIRPHFDSSGQAEAAFVDGG